MNWTVRRRIVSANAALLCLLVLVIGGSIAALRSTANTYRAVVQQERQVLVPAFHALDAAQSATLDFVWTLLSDGREGGMLTEHLATTRTLLEQMVLSAPTEADRNVWEEARADLLRWGASMERAVEDLRAGRIAEARRVRDSETNGLRDQFYASMRAGLRQAEARADAAAQEAARTQQAQEWLLLLGGFIAVLIGLISGWLLNRAVSRPLQDTSGVIASSAAEILASTTQQATGASESLAAVTQTVATVEEVNQTAQYSAQRAGALAESAQRAAEIGRAGLHAVEETVASINRVDEQVSSIAESILSLAEQAEAIGEIIASVTGVAEKTHMVALNASIEAVRAGEHGKGFGVVAGEIRSLAEQARASTVEVRQLLNEIQRATSAAVMVTEEGSRQSAAGRKQAVEAGATIRELAAAVDGAVQAASQIVASAGQQATGMAQIRQAMDNIHEATQQNLASTQQAERAAEDLSQLGTRLLRLVGEADPRGWGPRAA